MSSDCSLGTVVDGSVIRRYIMKRNYVVVNKFGKAIRFVDTIKGIDEVQYFEKKEDAKKERREYNGVDEEGKERMDVGFRVSRGPDNL